MGNRLSEASAPPSTESAAPQAAPQERRKRLAEEMIGEQEVEDVTPKRKRIQTTSDYIYETLFNQGADSDITIHALGRCMTHTLPKKPIFGAGGLLSLVC